MLKSVIKQHPVASFFVLAYAISWVLWVPVLLIIKFVLPAGQDPGWLMLPMAVGTYSPTVAAIIMTRILEGKAGVKKLWAKFLVWRVGFRWWLATFLLPPILILAAMGIYALQGGTLGRFDPSQWYMVLLGPLFALPLFLGEELGWRGYALPRLQQKYSALWSSVIVGVLWAFWHTPAFWASEGTAISGQPVTLLAVGWYLIFTIGISILHTFVYNNTKESVLLAVLFHGMYTGPNVFPLFPGISTIALNQVVKLAVIPIWVMAVLVIARFGAARLSRQPDQTRIRQPSILKKRKRYFLAGLLVVLVVAVVLFAVAVLKKEPVVAFTPPITDAEGNEIPGSIAVIETVTLGGVEQTVTIRGADTTKPVLLFLHGGPGTPSSPWATWNNFHAELEANFVVVHWDQRGAGKSFSEALTPADMHVENFVSDTLELTDILRERFDQDKIFLWGHSWGSGLGFETLRVNSEPFYAFFASAVRPDWKSTQEMSYEKVLEMAHQANDAKAIQSLESIQPFDPMNMDHEGVKKQIMSQYLVDDFHTEGLGEAWLNYVTSGKSPEYPSTYIKQTLAGMDFTGQTISLEVVNSGYDLAVDFPVSTIPVHFFQGRYDYNCPGELAEEYYNSLEAPVKSFTWFENSAHDAHYDEPDRHNQEMIRIANETLAEPAE